MATAHTLHGRGDLIALGGGLEDGELPCRLLYALPHVRSWLADTLPRLTPFEPDTDLSPLEQVDALFHDFVSGENFAYYQRGHFMHPWESGVWELKTTDVRIFGWFPCKAVFIIANVDTMAHIKDHNLYAGYRDDTVRRRAALDLDEPKFVTGGYSDVF